MSIQEFQQIPDPYSSMAKFHDPGIIGNYPKEIQTICKVRGRMDFILGGGPHDICYNVSLVMGNYTQKSYYTQKSENEITPRNPRGNYTQKSENETY